MSLRKLLLSLLLLCSVITESQTDTLKSLEKTTKDFYKKRNFDSCIVFADKLFDEAKKSNSGLYMANSCRLKGMALYDLNKTNEALASYYKGLNLCKDTSENRTKVLIYNLLGLVSFDQKNFSAAKGYFKNEIALRKVIGDSVKIANSLLNLSAIYRKLHEIDSSGFLLNEVKQIVTKKKDLKLTAHYYHAWGTNFQLLKKLDSAAFYFDKALKIWLQLKDKDEALRPLFNLGLVYQQQKEYKKALSNYLQAEQITDELNLSNQKITVYGNLAELYSELKEYKNSTAYYSKYASLKDSLQKEEINNYILELDKQYQTQLNKEIIQKQNLEIAEKTIRIEKQNKRLYFFLLIIVASLSLLILILIYFGFQKRLNLKLDDAKKKFFSNVVHEIRTPLSMIQAPLSVLKTKLNSTDDLFHFQLAERNILRLNELITQMLDISKLDSHKYTLSESFGDLELFFNQLVDTYTKIALEKNIHLLSQINLHSKIVFFDKDALEKITGNLLQNAIKFTSENKQIGINLYDEETETGMKLILTVWDTGSGISEKEQRNIFNRFYRSDKTKKDAKGVGIGLALVKDLVDLQGGTIELSSKENNGSSFTITLNLKTKENTEETTVFQLNDPIQNAYQVLIIEDDKDVLEFNANYLEKNNFQILKSMNGKEALTLIEKNLPDLIICDLMLPEMDGLSLLKKVKSQSQSNHIPFIVLSAKGSSESRMELLKAGAQNYLAKPFLPEELLSLVKNQLDILSKKKFEFKEQIKKTSDVHEKFNSSDPYIQKMVEMVMKNLANSDFSVEKLADLMSINRSHFQRKVKSITGFSPSEIIKTIRLEKARELLLTKKSNVTEVAYQTGFTSQSYFTRSFTQHFSMSPTQMLHNRK